MEDCETDEDLEFEYYKYIYGLCMFSLHKRKKKVDMTEVFRYLKVHTARKDWTYSPSRRAD